MSERAGERSRRALPVLFASSGVVLAGLWAAPGPEPVCASRDVEGMAVLARRGHRERCAVVQRGGGVGVESGERIDRL